MLVLLAAGCGVGPDSGAKSGKGGGSACKAPAASPTPGGALSDVDGKAWAVLSEQCASCHSTGSPAPNLSTLDAAAPSKAQILDSVEKGRMPISTQLTEEQIAAVRAWAQEASLALADASATWNGGLGALVQQKCVACHSAKAPADKRNTPYLTTYAETRKAFADSLAELQGGTMPPAEAGGKLAQADVDRFKAWGAAGFPLGSAVTPTPSPTAAPTVAPTPAPITYAEKIKPLLDAKCASCHKPSVTAPDLSTFAAAKAGAAASLDTLNKGTMPPSGAKLEAADVALFKSWIDGGTIEGAAAPATDPAPTDGGQGSDGVDAQGGNSADAVAQPTPTPCPS
jgi:cytochrome c2